MHTHARARAVPSPPPQTREFAQTQCPHLRADAVALFSLPPRLPPTLFKPSPSSLAIARGVPLWNAGSVAAATALYYTVARAHASSEPHLAYGLAKAEKAARVCPSRTSQGWLLRRAMDRVLAAVANASPASDMVKEISTEAPMMVDAINEAIGKGIAMWNSGDVAGCTKTYRHTVEQFSEEEPLFAQALKDAKGAPVDRSHGGQGWIFRRAFDKVLAQCRKISSGSTTKSASSSSSSTPSSTWISSGSSSSYSASSSLPSSDSPSSSETHAMQSAIRAAITKGSQMWNHGDRAGCVREYMATAQKYASLSPRLAAAIKEAKGQSTSKQGWTLRRGFDDVLAHGAGGMGRGGAFGSWIWILACCVFVGVVGAAVRSACLKRRVRGGQRVAVVVGAEGAQNGAVVPMVAVAKMDPNQGGAGGLASAVIVDGRAVMSITVLQAHEETDLDMDGHMDLEAVEAVGGGGASVAVQAIVIATGARSGAAGGAGGVGGGAAAGEPMMLAHALP